MSTPKEPAGPSGKRYTPEFKQEALALIAAGRSHSQVSRDLGISIWTLGEWKKAADKAVRSNGPDGSAPETTEALVAEVARLRKALARSELHADILKKALAIVGPPPPDSSR